MAPRDQLRRTLFALPSAVKDLSPLSTGLIMKVLSLGTLDQGRAPFGVAASLSVKNPGHSLTSTVRSRETRFSTVEDGS